MTAPANVSEQGKLHELDAKLFKEYPSDVWEAMMKLHGSHINHTTPCYGPMFYWLLRAIGAHNAVEIGVAQGYSSWFMAEAIKDNNVRFQMKGSYYGIDVHDKSFIFDEWIKRGQPIKFIHKNSVEVHPLRDMGLQPKSVDFLFIDGWHQHDHILKEMEIYYPLLKDKGDGYLAIHDVYSWVEKTYQTILNDPRYEWESIRFMNNYGMAILRNMKNYDHKKVHWPQGDQKKEEGFVA